jgi:3-hydroxy-D-aspartate aldolase
MTENVCDLETAAAKFGVRLDVLVEIDVGGQRCGIAPGATAADLAREISRSRQLRFAGLQAYNGSAQHYRTHEERAAAISRAAQLTQHTIEVLRRDGLHCEVVSGSGTGTFELEAASGVWNELQPGSYIFMDADYTRNVKVDGSRFDTFEHALFLYVTVMSAPEHRRPGGW